jgi:ribosomal protein S18 acetylase RimI-like enzyme
MTIIKAKASHLEESLQIAKILKEWFTKEAIKNMKKDFLKQNLLVFIANKKVLGFLCFSKNKNYLEILWFGVDRNLQGKNIGTKLLEKLTKIAKKLKVRAIRVGVLTEKENYKPYESTRAFYNKKGFKKIATKKPEKPGWDIQDILEKKIK